MVRSYLVSFLLHENKHLLLGVPGGTTILLLFLLVEQVFRDVDSWQEQPSNTQHAIKVIRKDTLISILRAV